jgi:hypothetical protein
MQHGATTALKKYRKNLSLPVWLGDVELRYNPTTPTTKRSKKEKKFGYSPDTSEKTRDRPQAYWARGSTCYDPDSPHACSYPEGYQDTSYYDSWHFSISRYRILLCYYADPTSQLLKYRHLNAGTNRGIDNAHVQHLIKVLEAHIAKETREKQAQWNAYLKVISDIFLVWNGLEMTNEENGAFTHFERTPGLVGSPVEEYARSVGEVDDEMWATRGVDSETQVDEGEETDS